MFPLAAVLRGVQRVGSAVYTLCDHMKYRCLGVLVFLAVLAGAAESALAQSTMSWLDPRLIRQRPVLDYRLRSYFDEAPVHGQDAELGFMKQDLAFTTPIYQGEEEQWRLTSQSSWLHMPNNAVLPDSGSPVPDDLYDFRIGGGYGRQLEGGQVLGINTAIGSASDRPFESTAATAVSATAFMYWPRDEDSGWLTFLAGQTQLNGRSAYLFPGVGYYFTGEKLDGLLGLPAVWANYKPTDDVAIQGLFIPSRVMLDATWKCHEGVRLFATYDWEWFNYVLHDRTDKDDQFFYMEQRLYAGVELNLAANVELTVGVGYGFDRHFFQASGPLFTSRTDDFGIGCGALMFVKLSARF